MLARLIEWVQRLFGLRPRKAAEPVDAFVQRYEDATGENITAVIAGRLSSLTLGESTLAVEGNGQRAELLTGRGKRPLAEDAGHRGAGLGQGRQGACADGDKRGNRGHCGGSVPRGSERAAGRAHHGRHGAGRSGAGEQPPLLPPDGLPAGRRLAGHPAAGGE